MTVFVGKDFTYTLASPKYFQNLASTGLFTNLQDTGENGVIVLRVLVLGTRANSISITQLGSSTSRQEGVG